MRTILSNNLLKFKTRGSEIALMNRSLAMVAEWAWGQNRLKTLQDRQLLACHFFSHLKTKHGGAGSRRAGLLNIDRDLQLILRKLSYGGRSPNDVPAVRIHWLSQQRVVQSLFGVTL